MAALFYLAALVGVISTGMVITRFNAVHALLYLIVSFLAVALVFFHFRRAVHRDVGDHYLCRRHHGAVRLRGHDAESGYAGRSSRNGVAHAENVDRAVRPVGDPARGTGSICSVRGPEPGGGIRLRESERGEHRAVGPYLIGVELASMLLLPGLVGAYHLGRHVTKSEDVRA